MAWENSVASTVTSVWPTNEYLKQTVNVIQKDLQVVKEKEAIIGSQKAVVDKCWVINNIQQ